MWGALTTKFGRRQLSSLQHCKSSGLHQQKLLTTQCQEVFHSKAEWVLKMSLEDSKNNFTELLDRKEKIRARLGELSSTGVDDTQVLPGSKDVHWDLVMKEMVCLITV